MQSLLEASARLNALKWVIEANCGAPATGIFSHIIYFLYHILVIFVCLIFFCN